MPRLYLYLFLLAIFCWLTPAFASDCNDNGVEDGLDVASDPALDCNANGIPDSCDLAAFPQFIRYHYISGPGAIVPQIAANFDGAGGLDVIALDSATNEIVLISDAINGIYPRTNLGSFGPMTNLIAVDVDVDETDDLVGWNASTVSIIRVAPTTHQLTLLQQIAGGAVSKVAAGDLTGDGFPELIIGQSDAPELEISTNNGSGMFSSSGTVTLALSGSVTDILAVDLNTNGADEVVALVAPSRIVAFSPDHTVVFPALTMDGTGRRIFLSDFDGDADLDLIYVSDQELVSMRNFGTFHYMPAATQAITDPGANVHFRDFDGDGLADLVLGARLGILRGRTGGRFDVLPAFDQIDVNRPSVAGNFNPGGLGPDLFFGETGVYRNLLGAWSEDVDGNGKPDDCQPGLVTNPVYVPWNSFLGMSNILELVNPGQVDATITAQLIDYRANSFAPVQLSLSPGQQFDIIVNGMPGYSPDSYGMVKITFPTGSIDGRMTYYRPRPGFNEFEFVTTFPLSQPLRGRSALTFNTFDAQTTGSSRERRRVDEFVSLINLDPVKNLVITLRRFDLTGRHLLDRPIFLRPFERLDTEAGHESPGPNTVGANILLPDDPDVPYLAFSNRYGVTTDRSGNFLRYRYANTLQAQPGLLPTAKIAFSRVTEMTSVAELVNPSSAAIARFVQIFGANGSLVRQFPVVVAPYAQLHLQAADYLPTGEKGSLQVIAASESPFNIRSRGPVLQSVSYINDAKAKELVSAYTLPARAYFGGNPTGSYNRFLGMSDTLRITSTIAEAGSCSLEVFSNGQLRSTTTLNLALHETKDVALGDALGAGTDSYGTVRLTPLGTQKGIVADVVRRRPLPKGRVDFAASAPVR